MTATSNLTVPSEIILTLAVGLGATSTATHEAIDVAPFAIVGQSIGPTTGVLTSATDSGPSSFDVVPAAVRIDRSDSRWYRYVSQRLRELQNGEHDFTGFRVPPARVVQRARFLANSLFKPEHPTPSVVPSEEGDVLYIWHKAGWDLEIDIGLEEISVWAHDRRAGREWYGALDEMRDSVVGLLDFLAWH